MMPISNFGSTDDIPTDIALQRLWNIGRRLPAKNSVFDDFENELFTPQQETQCESVQKRPTNNNNSFSSYPSSCIQSDVESDYESLESDFQENVDDISYESLPLPKEKSLIKRGSITLDASTLGDTPARYTIPALDPHQYPVIGVYVDPRVIPGFKYYVKPLQAPGVKPHVLPALFEGRALTLQSIGRGYAKRFTFEADEGHLNDNDNYFWSDNRQEGFVFELEVVSIGDKFTVYDKSNVAQGTMEVLNIEVPQVEVENQKMVKYLGVEKFIKINITGKVEFYETGVAKIFPIQGIVNCVKKKGTSKAVITNVNKVTIGTICKSFILKPGIETSLRRVTVRGKDIGDVPTKYTMTGLHDYEIPVVGTYVDPRIVPGFYYRVRPNDRKEHLFNGRALKLVSIGMGYAKRLTFQPDSLLNPENYFWSDNHPDGVGLEPRAVHVGMKFKVLADGVDLGEAKVFRTDRPQWEEKQEIIKLENGKSAVVKYIHVEITCHVGLSKIGGAVSEKDDHLMCVYGLAVVRKNPGENEAKVVRIENVALNSQLNILFTQNHTELTFLPIVN